jgi:predicted nucleotidyltransferase
VRLFGSYARGDAEEDSDVDVAVIVDALTEPERTAAIDLAFEA